MKNIVELKPEWAEEIDSKIDELNQLKENLLDFYRQIGEELERRGWIINPISWFQEIEVFKTNPTKDDFFEAFQLIGDLFRSYPRYKTNGDVNGNGLRSLSARWSIPYLVDLRASNPTGCKVEYKKVTKTVYELVKVDCPEFQDDSK